MDGYALRGSELVSDASFTVVGESLAGHPFTGRFGRSECVRITTGAPLPADADTVIIQENCDRDGDRVTVKQLPEIGANVRRPGHDVRAGEVVCRAARPLTPFDIGWLSACGITELEVLARPRIALFSTGDELVAPGGDLRDGQIYDANRPAVKAILAALPVDITDLGILPDEPDRIEQALSAAAIDHALILTTGGVSVGDADYVRDIVERLGRIDLWRLNLKPGKPLAFGTIGNALFLGLPGNPVSTIVTCLLVAKPLVLKLAGATPAAPDCHRARLAETIQHSPGREEYQRGIREYREREVWVRVSGDQSSNRLATFSGADCLIRISKSAGDLSEGAEVEVLPLYGLLSAW